MKQPLYAIRDMLIEFHSPIVGVNDEQMIRDFCVFCSKKADLEKNDLQLYKIGEFDTVTGHISACEPEFMRGGMDNG